MGDLSEWLERLYREETAKRTRITVMSSLNEISTDQLGKGVVKGGGATHSRPQRTELTIEAP